MMLLIGFAFLAGIVTVLSPCILPVLPVILAGTVGGGKARPWGIITGFVLSFSVFLLTLSALVQVLGLSADVLRWLAAGVILAFGLVLVVPVLKDWFSQAMTKLTAPKSAGLSKPKSGFWGGLVLGSGLGLVWTPCVGPIMASVTTLALSNSLDAGAVLITFAFALGTALPMIAIMLGGRGLLNRLPLLTQNSGRIQRGFGILMLAAGIALVTGLDRQLQTWVISTFPEYGTGLTSLENNPAVQKELELRQNSTQPDPAADKINLLDFSSGGDWFNSPPLLPADLKNKVVLVDFWTYSCVNCLRTLPHLQNLQRHYAALGLVIVGIHSPEFAFEAQSDNLKTALRDLGVTWPVVQDNEFRLWRAYNNQYWPAHYLFDRQGKLVTSHFGEGRYAETETLVRGLLGEEALKLPVAEGQTAERLTPGRTPETYLGSDRSGVPEWSTSGPVRQFPEYLELAAGSTLSLEFSARTVYLVLAPEDGLGQATVTFEGKPAATVDVQAGQLIIGENRLYTLFQAPTAVQGTIKVHAGHKIRAYAFTFG